MMTVSAIQTPLKIAFPKVSSLVVDLHNNIMGKARTVSFVFRKEKYQMRFLSPKKNQYSPKIYFKLLLNQQPLLFGLSPSLSAEFLDSSLKDIDLKTLPSDIAAVLFEGFASEIFSSIELPLKASLTLENVFFIPPNEHFEHTVHVSITNTKTQTEYLGHFSMDTSLLEFFSKRLEAMPASVVPDWYKSTVTATVSIGNTLLDYEDYQNLKVNDIVLLDNSELFKKNIFTVSYPPNGSFQIQYQNPKATFIKMSETPPPMPLSARPKPAAAPSTPTPPVAAPANVSVQQTPPEVTDTFKVNISFDIGHKEISFQELKTINTGFTFELENPVQKPVTISVNGKAVGVGEILQIGEKIGVRVVEFKSHG